MFDTATSSVAALIPSMIVTLPFLGEVDIQYAVIAAIIFTVLSAFFWLVRTVILVRLESLAHRTAAQFDDTIVAAIKSIRPWVYMFTSLYVSLSLFTLPDKLDIVLTGLFLFALVWQAIQIVGCFVRYAIKNFVEKDEDGDGQVDPGAATTAEMLTLIAKIIMWVVGGLFVLSNLGVEVTSLIAGLGIGGIAIALALQGILSDLFASFSLFFDKPFRIGDFIVIGTDSGTVEKIGIKTTRLRTLQGEELVVSNAELTTARVQNFKKMEERRTVSQFGITYETPQEKVAMVNGVVERIFEDIEGARLDRTHFKSFGDSALIFEIVYYAETASYPEFMDKQQQLNFTLLERFAEIGIDFAYPTQTLYHKAI